MSFRLSSCSSSGMSGRWRPGDTLTCGQVSTSTSTSSMCQHDSVSAVNQVKGASSSWKPVAIRCRSSLPFPKKPQLLAYCCRPMLTTLLGFSRPKTSWEYLGRPQPSPAAHHHQSSPPHRAPAHHHSPAPAHHQQSQPPPPAGHSPALHTASNACRRSTVTHESFTTAHLYQVCVQVFIQHEVKPQQAEKVGALPRVLDCLLRTHHRRGFLQGLRQAGTQQRQQ